MRELPGILKNPVAIVAFPVGLLLIGIVGIGIFQYQKLNGELSKAKNVSPGQLTDDRQRELIQEVSSKILLPGDEKPTVAVVSDINRLKDQQFFASGQNGDVVLIYMNMRRAILYRPADKKIIEVAPVNLNQNPQATVAGASVQSLQVSPQATPKANTTPIVTPTPQPARFSIRNGTTVTGLAKSFEGQLSSKFPQAQVAETGNASKRTYEKTLLIDITGKRGSEGDQVASALGIVKGVLPPDELPPANADFLIILGADKK